MFFFSQLHPHILPSLARIRKKKTKKTKQPKTSPKLNNKLISHLFPIEFIHPAKGSAPLTLPEDEGTWDVQQGQTQPPESPK